MDRFRSFTILVAEDEETVLEDIGYTLRAYFQDVFTAKDGPTALECFEKHQPDLVLTDIRMPKMDGIDLVKSIRAFDGTTPIIMMTAYSDEQTLLKAVSLYLCDYLVKPVTHAKLIDVLTRCAKKHLRLEQTDFRLSPSCRYSFMRKVLYFGTETVELTQQEIRFIELLILHEDQALSYEEIDYHVWQDRTMSKNAIKTLVRKIRSKLPENVIKNIVGFGYKLERS